MISTSSYILSLTGQFTIAALHPDRVPAFLAAMEKVQSDLPDDQKHFLKPMTRLDLRQHALKGNMIAAFDHETGNIAGGILLTPVDDRCSNNDDKFAEFPRNYMSQDTAVIKIFVDKDHRKKGLMRSLLEAGEEHALSQGITDVIAKVAHENKGSMKGFGKAEFKKVADGKDPTLGYAVSYWYKECAPLASKGITSLNVKAHDNDNLAPAAFG